MSCYQWFLLGLAAGAAASACYAIAVFGSKTKERCEMNCPHCNHPIPPDLILKARQQEIASRKRPGRKLVPGPNKWGRAGKPKP